MTSYHTDAIRTLIAQHLQITQFTPMQEAAITQAAGHEDVMLLAPTGTGKTLAFVVPMVAQIRADIAATQALVIVPSRELALQITAVLLSLKTGLVVQACYGGRPTMDEHRKMLAAIPQIVVGTPGRILDHLQKDNLRAQGLRMVVLDEFDKSLELGFQEEMGDIFTYIPTQAQRMLTSATLLPEVPAFVQLKVNEERTLNYLNPQAGMAQLTEYVIHTPMDKLDAVAQLLTTCGSETSIVFVNYRESAVRVAQHLETLGFAVALFHGGLEQEVRERALFKFRSGCCNVLVSTDLSARGLDIQHIRHIIHYHLPTNQEAYVHRTGRTARWDALGNSYLLLNEKETLPDYLKETDIQDYTLENTIIKATKPQWVTLYIGKGKKEKVSKGDIVGFLCKKGQLRATDIGMIAIMPYHAYVSITKATATQALRLIQGEKLKGSKTKIEIMRQ